MKINNQIFFKTLSLTLLAMSIWSCDYQSEEEMIEPKYTFLIGAYTDDDKQGIGVLEFNPETGLLNANVIASEVINPSFVISNKAQSLVFAVEETSGESGGKVKVFDFDRDQLKLELKEEKPSFGDHPCYISLSPEENFLVVGNYSGGNFSAYQIENGNLTHVQTLQHEGQSINSARQEKAHVHSTVFHPNGNNLLVGDLGTDKIHLYDYNPGYAVPFQGASFPYIEVNAGAGPRHLVIHPNGKVVYLIHELSAEVGVYSFDEGKMSPIQAVSLTDREFIGDVGAAELRFSPDSKFLYASNRGDANEITAFEIDKEGKLEFVERTKSGGVMPRNFIITKDGKYLLVAHQESSDIVVFERNLKNGKLRLTDLKVTFNKPVYLFELE
ncbi:lactonase family protein [Mongoliibacter ruber]|uniref:6-phosphogluconolactonase (Cycloisomerase 2 family) n=1 Tax=Mongoliibacter ruber TaxID=1750599 RepID=A0A2T0WVE5_9BACT|nr:lactonase family protein [Mongoliibacter ruber]PRY90673.1 6-phosphogluconolactonase (cycloisomerase 2 family) [Mongoliibacter ruber]